MLIVPTDSHVSPRTLADTVSDESLSAETRFVWVLLPVVVPPTLPIGAVPPRIAARLEHLRESADTALRASDVRGRVEVVPCRSLPALLAATGGRDRLVLVGRAGWPVRRAAHGRTIPTVAAGTDTTEREVSDPSHTAPRNLPLTFRT